MLDLAARWGQIPVAHADVEGVGVTLHDSRSDRSRLQPTAALAERLDPNECGGGDGDERKARDDQRRRAERDAGEREQRSEERNPPAHA